MLKALFRSDEACVQRVMKDRFLGGVWRSTLRDPGCSPIVSEVHACWPMSEDSLF